MTPVSKLTEFGYELSDVNVVQAPISYIEHRAQCDPKIWICGRLVYPVIVAPMGQVTDQHNYKTWLDNGFMCVIPRTVSKSGANPDGLSLDERLKLSEETFVSFSLDEADSFLCSLPECDPDGFCPVRYVCIDLAQGTMAHLYTVCTRLKEMFGDSMVIMTGNVAVPEAYSFYANAGIDYMRCFIGSGSVCTTAANGGTYYPRATLLDKLRMEKEKWESTHDGKCTEIIADGGISNFDDIQKCIALGSFCVMSGSFFAKADESCGDIIMMDPNNKDPKDAMSLKDYLTLSEIRPSAVRTFKPYRMYYGMSTKIAQKAVGGEGNKTAEGIVKYVPVDYPIAKWADNMKSYLVSTMSYTDCRTIDELRSNTRLVVNLSGDKAYRK